MLSIQSIIWCNKQGFYKNENRIFQNSQQSINYLTKTMNDSKCSSQFSTMDVVTIGSLRTNPQMRLKSNSDLNSQTWSFRIKQELNFGRLFSTRMKSNIWICRFMISQSNNITIRLRINFEFEIQRWLNKKICSCKTSTNQQSNWFRLWKQKER